MHPAGFLRITALSHPTSVADPKSNRLAIERAMQAFGTSDVLLFPELCLSGYTCGELFLQHRLLRECEQQLIALANQVQQQLLVVGLPLSISGRLYNVAAALSGGKILGFVPKTHLPNYGEFYEARWFQPGIDGVPLPPEIDLKGYGQVPFGTDLLFQCGTARVAIEICEDLWVPIPPSSYHAIAGANVLLNLSASNETIAKAGYRKQLVSTQSARCLAAYAYASSGPTESSTDLVFGGHCIIAENGTILAESQRIGTGLSIRQEDQADGVTSFATSDIDLDRLDRDRRAFQTMHQIPGARNRSQTPYRTLGFETTTVPSNLIRFVDPHPFVPKSTQELHQRCAEVFEIQCAALAKRVSRLPTSIPWTIGVSGGLDSTLALLVAVAMCKQIGTPTSRILGMTMPGFGTTRKSQSNAERLMQLLGVSSETIDIRSNCFESFLALSHNPFGIPLKGLSAETLQRKLENLPENNRSDLVFENVQARMRTMLLMNRGFVLGTGDMSELALGWCTYNADHMSMYNVNCSVPKTLVKFLVRYVADHLVEPPVREILIDILNTPITPELLPLSADQKIVQSTEASIGPYELHDFFLYHFVRSGAEPRRILLLADQAQFDRPYSQEEIRKTLLVFLKRFFTSQFKRTCVPDGPKVGSVSLSPRGDWRMPTDAEVDAWLHDLEPNSI